jgi:hypothetical protein
MLTRSYTISMAALAAAVLIVPIPSANALTMKECSAKYKAAQSAGTLKGMKWNDFRKAECGPTASPTSSSAPPATDTTAAPKGRSVNETTRPQTTGVGSSGTATFPSAISPKYSKESAGKARMHTCLDQYNANKASDRNGGLKWIEKGGGYYSECNKQLKG